MKTIMENENQQHASESIRSLRPTQEDIATARMFYENFYQNCNTMNEADLNTSLGYTLAACDTLAAEMKTINTLLMQFVPLIFHKEVIPHIPGNLGEEAREWLKSLRAAEVLDLAERINAQAR